METKSNYEISKEMYEELFTPEDKIKAFDKLAENYYMCNFATFPKADIDLFMFSEYLDCILTKQEEDMNAYSDYRLSKYLGITQSRISSLKEKKELKYPYQGFDWKKSFMRIAKNGRYENGNVIFNIMDKNLYIEIKNAIEENGGYIDAQLNPRILKIPIEYYLDFIMLLSDADESKKQEVKEELQKQLRSRKEEIEFVEKESNQMMLKKAGLVAVPEVISAVVSTCFPGSTVGGIVSLLTSVINKF